MNTTAKIAAPKTAMAKKSELNPAQKANATRGAEGRSEAAHKANVTRGVKGRSEAAHKAATTRKAAQAKATKSARNTKLTLKLDRDVIERAKLYTRHRGVSLSRVVESYLLGLTRDEQPAARQRTGIVAELAGLLAGREVDTSKEGYAEHLVRKYS